MSTTPGTTNPATTNPATTAPIKNFFPDPITIWKHIDIAMVRDSAQYDYREGSFRYNHDKIQLGAGFKNLSGWRNLEYPMWNADRYIPSPSAAVGGIHPPRLTHGVTGEYLNPEKAGRGWIEPSGRTAIQPGNSISEIASYHTLDHLSPNQVVNTLREVERVLIPGGTFTNIVPHADSQLAKECIHHQSRFMIDTWRNIFSERQYEHDGDWQLEVGLNFTFAIAERNTVLITQLIKKEN